MPQRRPVVRRQRADERVRRPLLHDVRGPADDAGRDEDGREQVGVQTQQVVGGARGVVQVRLDVLGLHHRGLERVGQVQQVLPTAGRREVPQRGLHRGDAGVPVAVDAVAEPHDLAVVLQGVGEPRAGPVRRPLPRPDLLERGPHGLVGPTVQRPLSAPTAAVTAECRSDSVDVTTRAANVEALKECSAYRTSDVSNVRTATSSGSSPVTAQRKFARVAEVGARRRQVRTATPALAYATTAGSAAKRRSALASSAAGESSRPAGPGAEHADGGADDVHGVRRRRQVVDDARTRSSRRARRAHGPGRRRGSRRRAGRRPTATARPPRTSAASPAPARVPPVQQRVRVGVDLRDAVVSATTPPDPC